MPIIPRACTLDNVSSVLLKVVTNRSISNIFELIKEELLKEDISYWLLKNNI